MTQTAEQPTVLDTDALEAELLAAGAMVIDEDGLVIDPEPPPLPPVDLPYDDGVPLESNWHRLQMNLLIESVAYRWRDRRDFVVGGNMFIYYSLKQAERPGYRGPDFFVVKDVDGSYSRNSWIAWAENGRLPDVIVELMSPSTRKVDLGAKKKLYERTFRTPDYFCYDPETRTLHGWRLRDGSYEALTPNEQGWLWSAELDAWLGVRTGAYLQQQGLWLRLFDQDGELVLIEGEAERLNAEAERQRADDAYQRAEAERQRAEAAEAELVRLRAVLARTSAAPPDPPA